MDEPIIKAGLKFAALSRYVRARRCSYSVMGAIKESVSLESCINKVYMFPIFEHQPRSWRGLR